MVNLILLGSAIESTLTTAVQQALSKKFQVASVCAGNRIESCDAPDFLLLECEHFFCGEGSQSIILCKNSFSAPAQPCGVQGRAVGVLQPDNPAAAALLGQLGIPAISCGMSLADTLTFSSLRADSAVVCLQRSIPTLAGGTVEPAELSLRLSRPYDEYALMCIVAVLLLTGNGEQLGDMVL